jgi:hypothetical protein
LDSAARNPIAVTPDASRYRRDSGLRRPTRISMAVLTRNFVDAGMHTMAERYRLDYVSSGSPRPLRQGDGGATHDEHQEGQREDYPVHADDQVL